MKRMGPMRLTTVFLGEEERRALALLKRALGLKSQGECVRVAIREAAAKRSKT